MGNIKIVSDGTPLGVKLFDEEGMDITNAAGKNCTGIDIRMRASEIPTAVFQYLSVPIEVTAIKVDEYEESPIQVVFFWKGKDTREMSAEDIKDCYDWCDRHPGEDKTGFLSAVQRRYFEINTPGFKEA